MARRGVDITTIDGDTARVVVPGRGDRQNASGFSGIGVEFWCECCGGTPVLDLWQRKGNTLFEWRWSALVEAQRLYSEVYRSFTGLSWNAQQWREWIAGQGQPRAEVLRTFLREHPDDEIVEWLLHDQCS
jgi:hypothetical protein